MNLIEWLAERQGDESDRSFAPKLGITPEYWGMLKRGTRGKGRLSIPVAQAAARMYPQDLLTICRLVLQPPERNPEEVSA